MAAVTQQNQIELLTSLRRQNEDLRSKTEKLEDQSTKDKEKLEGLLKELQDSGRVKDLLKSKLKECRSRLEEAVEKCQEQQDEISKFRQKEATLGHPSVDQTVVEKCRHLEQKCQELQDEVDKFRQKDATSEPVNVDEDVDKCRHLEQIQRQRRHVDFEDQSRQIKDLESKLKAAEEEISKHKLEKSKSTFLSTEEEDVKLLKVEVRLAEKKVKEMESRLKFVREVMLKEEKEAKEELQGKLGEMQKGMEQKRIQSVEQDLKVKDLQSELKVLKSNLEESKKSCEKIKELETKNSELESKVAYLEKDLQSNKEKLLGLGDVQTNFGTLRQTCLELEDQLKDYEKLVSKLENRIHQLSKEKEDLKCNLEEKLKSKDLEAKRQIQSLNETISLGKKEKSALTVSLKESKENEKSLMLKCDNEMRLLEDDLEARDAIISDMKQVDEKIRLQMTELTSECGRVSDQNLDLKEQISQRTTQISEMKDTIYQLQCAMQSLLDKLSNKNVEIVDFKNKLKGTTSELEKKEIENHTQISQLKKLVDHLQSKADEKKVSQKSSSSSKTFVMNYEELLKELQQERRKNAELRQEALKFKSQKNSRSATSVNEVQEIAKKDLVAETNHSIPHRFVKQTNVKVTVKCTVCQANIPFCKPYNVCKFCHRACHVSCQKLVPDDCGLTNDLALVLKSRINDQNTSVSHKGYLRVPENGYPGKVWSRVGVQIAQNKLIIDSKSKNKTEIDLQPLNGNIYVHGTVSFAETKYASIYEKPLIFKIGYSSGSKVRNSHYFMANTLQEKASWIEAIEKVTLQISPERNGGSSPSKNATSPNCSILTSFPSETAVFCAVHNVKNKHSFYGTSIGLFLTSRDDENMDYLEKGPDNVFQMEYLPEFDEFIMIIEKSRKLVVVKRKDILRSALEECELAYQNLDAVSVSHMFEVGRIESKIYICAVDDQRVSILSRRTDSKRGVYEMEYGFSTDQPTSSIAFTSNSVLVMTNKIYDINLTNDFEVKEFLDSNLDRTFKEIFIDNNLIDIFPLKGEKFLLCFQDFGFIVDKFGKRLSEDLKWTNSVSQAFVSDSEKLWLGYHNSLECYNLERKATCMDRTITCKNSQILSAKNSQEDLIFVDKKSDLLVIMKVNRNHT